RSWWGASGANPNPDAVNGGRRLLVSLESFEHVEQVPFVPTRSDQRAVERALTLAIPPVSAREPVITRQDALEHRRVTVRAAPEAPGLDRGERRAAGQTCPSRPPPRRRHGAIEQRELASQMRKGAAAGATAIRCSRLFSASGVSRIVLAVHGVRLACFCGGSFTMHSGSLRILLREHLPHDQEQSRENGTDDEARDPKYGEAAQRGQEHEVVRHLCIAAA